MVNPQKKLVKYRNDNDDHQKDDALLPMMKMKGMMLMDNRRER